MDDLSRALGDISSIRRQMARTTEFRGYGPATLAATGVFAMVAACVQRLWVSDPARDLPLYLAIWGITAIVSAALIVTQMQARTRRIHSGMADEMIRMAAEQFLPAAIAGALLTVVLVVYAPAVAWMLPGLWQIVFSLGVFSSCRFLPRPMLAAGAWYLACGLICLRIGDERAFSALTMGIAYGVGQMLVAAILLATREEAEDGN